MIFGFDGSVYTSLLRCEGYQGSLVFDTGSTVTLFSAGAFAEFGESDDKKEKEVRKWALEEFEKWLQEQNPDTNQTKMKSSAGLLTMRHIKRNITNRTRLT